MFINSGIKKIKINIWKMIDLILTFNLISILNNNWFKQNIQILIYLIETHTILNSRNDFNFLIKVDELFHLIKKISFYLIINYLFL